MDYERLCEKYRNALSDLVILSGDIVGPSDASWQDVAGTAAVNLHALARAIQDARHSGPFVVFPSVDEVLDSIR